jgi:hypothetical protein
LVRISANRFVPGVERPLRVEVEIAARRLRMRALKSLGEILRRRAVIFKTNARKLGKDLNRLCSYITI